jgi:hypothetical protein
MPYIVGSSCRCRVEQLLRDQRFLESQWSSCASCKDTVEAFFWSTLGSIVSAHIPEGHSSMEPASVVETKPREPADEPLDATGQFLESLQATVAQLANGLAHVDKQNPAAASQAAAPRRSKQEMAKLAERKQVELLAAVGELLSLTSGAREGECPLLPQDVVREAALMDVAPHLIQCLAVQHTAETRVQASGSFSLLRKCTLAPAQTTYTHETQHATLAAIGNSRA